MRTFPIAGILLTGGASRRMGADKATLRVGGVPMAIRLAELLRRALDGPLVEVGPGRSGLAALPDELPGAGPLVAVATAARHLSEQGWHGPALVLACDLPRLSPAAVEMLAGWPGQGAVLPVLGGRRQPLCARWAADDLATAVRRAVEGQRSLRGLPDAGAGAVVTEAALPPGVSPDDLADADTPDELADALAAGGASDIAVAVSGRTPAGRGAR